MASVHHQQSDQQILCQQQEPILPSSTASWTNGVPPKQKIKEKSKHLTVKPIRLKVEEPSTSIKKTINPKISPDKVRPLDTQVAGHGTGNKISHRGMLIYEGFVLKPAQAPPKGTREIEFYKNVSNSFHPIDVKLYSLMPKFYGVEDLSRDGVSQSQYLILEDLTQGMSEPCVMDIKIGAKTYGPDATQAKINQEDAKYLGTKKPLGFSVLGIVNRSGENNTLRRYDKCFGMNLKTDCVSDLLHVYFDTHNQNSQQICNLVSEFTKLLAEVKTFFTSQSRYHIYASSLLFVYDHQALTSGQLIHQDVVHKHVRLKIIDFAHVFDGEGSRDENFLFGLTNLHHLFENFTM